MEEEDSMRRAKANVAPLLWKAYTMCGEVEYSTPEMLLCIGHGKLTSHSIFEVFLFVLLFKASAGLVKIMYFCKFFFFFFDYLFYLSLYVRVVANHLDMSVDNWALGCLMHELLTGRTPFSGSPIHSKLEIHEKILSTLEGGMRTARRETSVDVRK
jgi:serine/threonine protein kinase